jgi:hypothetical protein
VPLWEVKITITYSWIFIAATHSFFNIMLSVIALDNNVGSELYKKVGFKPSAKLLVALRGVYNFTRSDDDPLCFNTVNQ